MFLDYVL